ncbi:MAG: hypothetical protein JRF49_10040 [Deltaproteobacteria bacterium]|nr:hypothetical protein [Deltaproteobacteria bacterium]
MVRFVNHRCQMKNKERGMNILETEYQINEQGMIVEEINEFEIDDVIKSIQEVDNAIEKLVFKNRFMLSNTYTCLVTR